MPVKNCEIDFFLVPSTKEIAPKPNSLSAYLVHDNWDDWDKFRTQYFLMFVDKEGERHDIGQLKIGQRGLKAYTRLGKAIPAGHREPNVPPTFPELDAEFFSIGQDDEYYENLKQLPDDVRIRILTSLRDLALDGDQFAWAKDELVTTESLLRSVSPRMIEGQFRRMANGDARVTPYEFSYTPPGQAGNDGPPFKLAFRVNPKSPIPTNIHVLIGRNGVGKTRLLSSMTKALVEKNALVDKVGKFDLNVEDDKDEFANVVAVSFSAFDEGELIPNRKPKADSIGFSHIGLRRLIEVDRKPAIQSKTPDDLADEFVNSLSICNVGALRRRWGDVIKSLQADPVFRVAEVEKLIDADLSKVEERRGVLKTFKGLSSGHKIVLLTLTRLVEMVGERTLVLIDEPEGHLHPPLLSAMTRSISELLVKRNGVAIIATHSPIILQETPRSCVWILNRIRAVSTAKRPEFETFGESVGILSREVFQLELSQSGFHKILAELRAKENTYDDALAHLKGNLGAEGRAVLRAMYLNNDNT